MNSNPHKKMTHKSTLIFLSIAFYSIFSTSGQSITNPDDISRWCTTTPHPEPCKYYISHSYHNFSCNNRSDFRKVLVQVSLERAMEALKHALEFEIYCDNTREKAALSDCLKLYDDTVLQINQTLEGLGVNRSCTDFDAQTWLSTALTNIETCRSGAEDLDVYNFITNITSNNVSELISNSLAINGVILEEEGNYTETKEENYTKGTKFPMWVSKSDRRLLVSAAVKANLVVAKDGSGNFRTVQAAIDAAAKRRGGSRFVIYIKRGVYRENIEVGNNNNNIMLIGAGMKYTIITSSRSVQGGYTTYNSATAGIGGLGFIARGITFVNSAGARMGQAVALRSSSDLSVFYRCAFQGYQDTLMVLSQRQFYRECYIYGTIDFIFGNAAVVFQNCLIYVKRPLKGQANVVTAQGRDDPYQNTGISIHNSQVRAAPDLQPVISTVKTYLGRPWKKYSRTVILKSYIDSLVSPVGWLEWDKTGFALDSLYYGEYNNIGPRASTKYRVRWRGFHVITSPKVASRFTVSSFIAGQTWLPATRVPFKGGL